MLRRIQSEQAGLLDHHHVSLTDIQDAVGPALAFDTLTVFESYPVDRSAITDADISGLRLVRVHEGSDAAHYPLTLVANADDRLRMKLKFLPDLFDRGQARSLAERVQRVLVDGVGGSAVPARSGGPGRRNRRPRRRRARTRPRPVERHRALGAGRDADRSVRRPGPTVAVALTFGDEQLTYAEFASRARRLARELIARGVGPRAGWHCRCGGRSTSVIGMYAVTEAGGAYVPSTRTTPPPVPSTSSRAPPRRAW
ncbi:hypothetical protein RE9416_24180 [Prescottella equi]|nr:hypothetical protein RE9416_24180 [Prescottella equi]